MAPEEDGSRFWANGEMMALRDEAGAAIGFLKMLRDRTAQHQAAEQIAASEARYSHLFDSIDEGFCIIEFLDGPHGPLSDYVHVEANPAYERHTGIANVVGQTIRGMAPGEADGWIEIYSEVLRTGQPVRFEREFCLAGGYIEVTANRIEPASRRQVAILFNNITERRVATQKLAASEERWRGLFEGMQEGFFLGDLVRDATGHAVDVRFLEINPAFARQSGLPADSIGRTIRSFVPDIDQGLIDTYATVVETGEPALFEITIPELRRSFEVRAQKERDDRFSGLFLDITDRKRSDVRRSAMAELSDRLRGLSNRAAIARIASEIMGKTLGLSHAGYGQVDPEQETILVAEEWSAPGLRDIGGLHQFRDYGSYIEDLKAGREVIVPDTALDPRTAEDAVALAAIDVAAIFNLPVMEHDRFKALFYVVHAKPREWAPEDLAFVRNVADRTRAAIARVEAEEQQRVLNLELSHRLKNTLTMVQSIASQTLRNAESMPAARDALASRLVALGKSHDILLSGHTNSAMISAVIEGALALHQDQEGRIRPVGPDLRIGPSAALSLSLMLHELATNATKYGALSRPHGYVDLIWTVRGAGSEAEFQLIWTEYGGPPVHPPSRTGFGSRLIQRGLAGGTVEVRYPPEGVICMLTTAVTALVAGS